MPLVGQRGLTQSWQNQFRKGYISVVLFPPRKTMFFLSRSLVPFLYAFPFLFSFFRGPEARLASIEPSGAVKVCGVSLFLVLLISGVPAGPWGGCTNKRYQIKQDAEEDETEKKNELCLLFGYTASPLPFFCPPVSKRSPSEGRWGSWHNLANYCAVHSGRICRGKKKAQRNPLKYSG